MLRASEPATQLNRIIDSLESQTVHRIECFVCCERDKDYDATEAKAARGFYEDGWRYVESEKFQTIGVMCPQCAKTPDKDRGE